MNFSDRLKKTAEEAEQDQKQECVNNVIQEGCTPEPKMLGPNEIIAALMDDAAEEAIILLINDVLRNDMEVLGYLQMISSVVEKSIGRLFDKHICITPIPKENFWERIKYIKDLKKNRESLYEMLGIKSASEVSNEIFKEWGEALQKGIIDGINSTRKGGDDDEG